MLWIWSCPVSTKELFLKIVVPKRQTKSLKSNCEVVEVVTKVIVEVVSVHLKLIISNFFTSIS